MDRIIKIKRICKKSYCDSCVFGEIDEWYRCVVSRTPINWCYKEIDKRIRLYDRSKE